MEREHLTFNAVKIWTIGHSTLAAAEFIARLQSFQIERLADVRSFPGSRRYPHFNRANLSKSLGAANIDYVHLPELGGRRRARANSHNLAWRNESFRGYADYMETEDFKKGVDRLLDLARDRRTAMMCAESLWWRCHRSLISDYLKVKGIEVTHILDVGKSEEHPYTSAAQIVGGEISYRGVLRSESSE